MATAIDILNSIAEFNSSILRDHILKQPETTTEVCMYVLYVSPVVHSSVLILPIQDNQFLNIILSLLIDGECNG